MNNLKEKVIQAYEIALSRFDEAHISIILRTVSVSHKTCNMILTSNRNMNHYYISFEGYDVDITKTEFEYLLEKSKEASDKRDKYFQEYIRKNATEKLESYLSDYEESSSEAFTF